MLSPDLGAPEGTGRPETHRETGRRAPDPRGDGGGRPRSRRLGRAAAEPRRAGGGIARAGPPAWAPGRRDHAAPAKPNGGDPCPSAGAAGRARLHLCAEGAPLPPDLAFDALPPVTRGSTLGTEWALAVSHLRSKKADAWLSATTLLSVVGVAAGVALLNWVIAVMTGFEDDLRAKILGARPHVVVTAGHGPLPDPEAAVAAIVALDGVVAATPYSDAEVLLRSPWGGTGVAMRGLDPARAATSELAAHLTEGYDPAHRHLVRFGEGDLETRSEVLASLGEPFPAMGLDGAPLPETAGEPALPGILVGAELRDHLGVRAGDQLQLVDPFNVSAGPMGAPIPKVRPVRVAAVFDSGVFEHDAKWVYVTADLARAFQGRGHGASGVEVRVRSSSEATAVARAIEARLGAPYDAQDWTEQNAKLFEALALTKAVTGLIFDMVIAMAGLLLVCTLILVVLTKRKEIAVLKAMGATSGTILRIFFFEGFAIGAIGTATGTLLGLLGCAVLDRYRYPLDVEVYYLDTLPVVVEPLTVALIAAGALLTCSVCTLYPAWQASRVDPVEGLRS